jgi:uncharacterized protein YggE
MLQRTFSTLTAFVCAAGVASAARAAAPPATVAGTGEASVRIVPTKLRMQVEIEAHGKTAELAIERLKARREAVAEKLQAIGAEKESIKFGDPSVNKVAPAAGPVGYSAPAPSYAVPAWFYPPAPGAPSWTPAPEPPRFVPGPVPAPAPVIPLPAPSAPVPYPPPGTPPASSSPAPAGAAPYLPPGSATATFTPSPYGTSPAAPDAEPAPGTAPSIAPAAAPSPPVLAPAPAGAPPAPPSTDDPFWAPAPAPAPTTYPPTPPAAPAAPSGRIVLPPAAQRATFPSLTIQPRRYPHPSLDLYAATATLTVDWPLKAETVEQAVLAGEAVRKKVQAADLMGGKAAEKLPDDEQELLDELGPSANLPGIPSTRLVPGVGPNAGRYVQEVFEGPSGLVPSFLYVATISSQQRKAVLAEAFGNAKSQAAELAEAAGGKLGALQNTSGEVSNSKPLGRFTTIPPPDSLSIPVVNENNSEATAADPASGLKFYARVWGLFRLE